MKLHANAQTCPHCRFLIVSRVMSVHAAAATLEGGGLSFVALGLR